MTHFSLWETTKILKRFHLWFFFPLGRWLENSIAWVQRIDESWQVCHAPHCWQWYSYWSDASCYTTLQNEPLIVMMKGNTLPLSVSHFLLCISCFLSWSPGVCIALIEMAFHSLPLSGWMKAKSVSCLFHNRWLK